MVTVFALNNKGINSNVKISFNAVDIEGKVELYSTLKTGTEVKLGETEFTPTKTAGNINVDAVELDATDDYITFKYKFYNYGSRSYSALLRYLDYPTSENIEVLYSQNDSEYLKSKSIIIVDGKTANAGTNEYFVRVKVADLAFNANFEGDFSWLLEKYTGDQEFSLGAVDYIYDSTTDTYTAAYNGAALENNTLYIASKVGSANVTTVGKMASLPANTTVVLEEGITEIDNSAFKGNSGLVAIEVPASLETIDLNAFRDCANLTSITFPENSNLKEIKNSAFQGTGIEDISLPNNLEELGNLSFYNSKITNFTIPASVTTIGAGVFSLTPNLTTIIIEEGNACYKMEGNCLIENSTGRLIKGFNDSIIPSDGSIKIIGENAFLNQREFNCTEIPEGVTRIEGIAFQQCNGIEEILLPESLTYIGNVAFYSCDKLSKVNIPHSVSYVGTGAFANCSLLNTIVLDSNNAYYKMDGNCLVEISTGKLLQGFNNTVIPTDGSVKIIEAYAFKNKRSLSTLEIPSSVTKIGRECFLGCVSLTEISIPSSVDIICQSAFNSCTNLKNVTLETTSGWFYADTEKATSGTTLSSLDLANTSTTADYLTKTYSQYFWKRV